MSAFHVIEHVNGSPFQRGEAVMVVDAIDRDIYDLSLRVGQTGRVVALEYSCGSGQHFPDDPMVGVVLQDGTFEEFWKEELAR